jgi:hypothetical protein
VLVALVEGGTFTGSPTFVAGTGGAPPSGDASGAIHGPVADVHTY